MKALRKLQSTDFFLPKNTGNIEETEVDRDHDQMKAEAYFLDITNDLLEVTTVSQTGTQFKTYK